MEWRDSEGVFRPFSVACAWNSIRLRAVVVDWYKIRLLTDMSAIPPRIEDALAFITPISKGNSVLRIISRIVLAVATYYLWNERNSRLFKNRVSFAEQVFQDICYNVRLKLVTFKFKKVSARSHILLDRWKVPRVFKEVASLRSFAHVVLLLASWGTCLASRVFLAYFRQCGSYS
ncbi:hypothetical protein Tco_1142696 [Tanacetum coccineum]